MNMRIAGIMGAAAAGLVFASAASAQQTILTFGFDDLNGSFNTGTSTFSAMGVNSGSLHSTGYVSRLQAPVATATYLAGDAAGLVGVSLSVTSILPTTANGNGTITIQDANGDLLTASIDGQFIGAGPAVFFNGSLSNVAFTSVSGDGMFNGPDGGAFPLNFNPAPPPYTGAIVQLYIDTAGSFFAQSFSGIATQVSGAVIPAPGSLALMGLGLTVAGRRRRRA